jgi:hypothetical protein
MQGLTEGPTQQYCSLIKSCKKLQQLSMPHCCYQDTYKPLQILYSHCRNLTSLDFGYHHFRRVWRAGPADLNILPVSCVCRVVFCRACRVA